MGACPRLLLPLGALGLLMLGGCLDSKAAADLKVAVLRQDMVNGSPCFRLCSGEGNFDELCADHGPATCTLMPGFDVVRVVVDYGSFPLEEGKKLQAPTLKFSLDTQAMAPQPGSNPELSDEVPPRWRSITNNVTIPVPPKPAAQVRLTAEVGSTYSADLPDPLFLREVRLELSHTAPCGAESTCKLPLSVGQVAFTVSVPNDLEQGNVRLESRVDDLPDRAAVPVTLRPTGTRLVGTVPIDVPARGSSWKVVAIAGAYSSLPAVFTLEDPALILASDRCSTGTSCSLERGTGHVAFEVRAPRGFRPSLVTIEKRVDDQLPTKQEIQLEDRGGVLTALGTVQVPERGDTLRLQVVTGSARSNTLQFTLGRPQSTLTLSPCPASGICALEAGVGKAYLNVSVPGDFLPSSVQVQQSVGAAPYSLVQERPFELLETQKAAVFALSVPDTGSAWTLRVTAGQIVLGEIPVQLLPSTLSVTVLGCTAGQQCRVTAGTEVTVLIDAPRESHETSAGLTYRVNNGPATPSEVIPLDSISGDRRLGSWIMTVPETAAGKSLQFHARLGSFAAASNVLLVDPP